MEIFLKHFGDRQEMHTELSLENKKRPP